MSRSLAREQVQHEIAQLADTIARHFWRPGTALIGLRTRGVPLAERLAGQLRAKLSQPFPVGSLEITFYRDDLALRANWPEVRGSDIPFSIEDRDVILVDDVLHTGRTVVAAMRALLDLGRPARLALAVLVDRGGREFPVSSGVRRPARRSARSPACASPPDRNRWPGRDGDSMTPRGAIRQRGQRAAASPHPRGGIATC